MLRLLTTWYDEPQPVRCEEYRLALERNLACPAIDEIWVMHEGGELPEDPGGKLHVRTRRGRPLYSDFFSLINEIAADDDISIVANTDIFLTKVSEYCLSCSGASLPAVQSRGGSGGAFAFPVTLPGQSPDAPLQRMTSAWRCRAGIWTGTARRGYSSAQTVRTPGSSAAGCGKSLRISQSESTTAIIRLPGSWNRPAIPC